jgi:hypothetical protein
MQLSALVSISGPSRSASHARMSALGQKRTLRGVRPMSALPPKADIMTFKAFAYNRHAHARLHRRQGRDALGLSRWLGVQWCPRCRLKSSIREKSRSLPRELLFIRGCANVTANSLRQSGCYRLHDRFDDVVDRWGQHGLCGAPVVARLPHDRDRLHYLRIADGGHCNRRSLDHIAYVYFDPRRNY